MAWSTSKHRGSTRQSRHQRAIVLANWHTCYIQGPGCTMVATEDDHVIPLSQGGTDDLANRRGACASCHKRKTAAESGAARRRPRPSSGHPGLMS